MKAHRVERSKQYTKTVATRTLHTLERHALTASKVPSSHEDFSAFAVR